jgi:hypothetical protein
VKVSFIQTTCTWNKWPTQSGCMAAGQTTDYSCLVSCFSWLLKKCVIINRDKYYWLECFWCKGWVFHWLRTMGGNRNLTLSILLGPSVGYNTLIHKIGGYYCGKLTNYYLQNIPWAATEIQNAYEITKSAKVKCTQLNMCLCTSIVTLSTQRPSLQIVAIPLHSIWTWAFGNKGYYWNKKKS